eukprot:757490-Hanusia_phi.AAC.6
MELFRVLEQTTSIKLLCLRSYREVCVIRTCCRKRLVSLNLTLSGWKNNFGVIAISSGMHHSCVIVSDSEWTKTKGFSSSYGRLRCWGSNLYNQTDAPKDVLVSQVEDDQDQFLGWSDVFILFPAGLSRITAYLCYHP